MPIGALSALKVDCVKGCDESVLVLTFAVGSLIVSLVALTTAIASWRMQRTEHTLLLQELRAIAEFQLGELELRRTDEVVDAPRMLRLLAVTFRNSGTKLARDVVLNVTAPEYAELAWADRTGKRHHKYGEITTTEGPVLDPDDGIRTPTHILSRSLDVMGKQRKATWYVRVELARPQALAVHVEIDSEDAESPVVATGEWELQRVT